MKQEQPKVNVILAVYNGEKYLRKQLDSLLAQTYENMDIYVRDDGSSDGTLSLLKEYRERAEEYRREKGSGKRLVLLDGDGVNLGCPESFYEILRKCEKADYYGFCDQDDEWYPQKVAWAVERLNREDPGEVLLYYTASDYLTEDGTLIRKSPLQKEQAKLLDVLYYSPGSGFTMVFNECARQKLVLKCRPGPELHDRWLLRGAACFGKAIYDNRSSAAHIRHPEAVTAGDSDDRSLILHFIKNELCGDDIKRDKAALQYFYGLFQTELSAEERKLLKLFAGRKNTPVSWLKKVCYPHRLRRRLPGELALRLLFFAGKV